jgi:hypothetical protein
MPVALCSGFRRWCWHILVMFPPLLVAWLKACRWGNCFSLEHPGHFSSSIS